MKKLEPGMLCRIVNNDPRTIGLIVTLDRYDPNYEDKGPYWLLKENILKTHCGNLFTGATWASPLVLEPIGNEPVDDRTEARKWFDHTIKIPVTLIDFTKEPERG